MKDKVEVSLRDLVPKEFLGKLPINIYYIKGVKENPIVRTDMVFSTSKFYQTDKMRCFIFYKPIIL